MNTGLPLFDSTVSKHGGEAHSVAANLRAEPGKAIMRERARVFINACGPDGATSHEIEASFGIPKYKFSGRLTDLVAMQLIFKSGRSRNGAAVLVSRREWTNGSAQ